MLTYLKMTPTVRLLAISGSLRSRSSNTALLQAAAILAPPEVEVVVYAGLHLLPHFNPDLEEDPGKLPSAVIALRAAVGAADGLLISCPEYARGVPGSFKNLLDWLVGSSEFPGKPVAILNTSDRGTAAQAALRLILSTMSARIIEEASLTIQLQGQEPNAQSVVANEELAQLLRAALATFMRSLRRSQIAKDL